MGRFRGITVSKGSRLDDVITGSEGRDLVFARGGDDVIETGVVRQLVTLEGVNIADLDASDFIF